MIKKTKSRYTYNVKYRDSTIFKHNNKQIRDLFFGELRWRLDRYGEESYPEFLDIVYEIVEEAEKSI